MENLYDVLEVSSKASKEVIDRAYKTLAKKYHPDLHTGEDKVKAEEMMKKLNYAYSILGDEEKKAEYDESLEKEHEVNQENSKYKEDKVNYEEKNTYYNYTDNYNYTYGDEESKINQTWRSYYENLSPKEQWRVRKTIERDAKNEYRKLYENYFRSLGYKVPHRWTLKEIKIILIIFLIVLATFGILWIIPGTRNSLIELYKTNFLVKLVVDLIRGIIFGIGNFIKLLFGKKI